MANAQICPHTLSRSLAGAEEPSDCGSQIGKDACLLAITDAYVLS